MSIKTITVFVDGGPASDARLAAACDMALKHEAHVVAVAFARQFDMGVYAMPGAEMAMDLSAIDTARAEAKELAKAAEAKMQAAGVSAMPTFHFMKKGEKLDEMVGAEGPGHLQPRRLDVHRDHASTKSLREQKMTSNAQQQLTTAQSDRTMPQREHALQTYAHRRTNPTIRRVRVCSLIADTQQSLGVTSCDPSITTIQSRLHNRCCGTINREGRPERRLQPAQRARCVT